MVIILNYVLLGILIYIVAIPVLEELATVIVQGLEVIKGLLIIRLNKLQEQAEKPSDTKTHVIGFTIPDDEEDYEEEIEEDDY